MTSLRKLQLTAKGRLTMRAHAVAIYLSTAIWFLLLWGLSYIIH